MVGKIFFIMCAMAFLGQVHPNPFTKEIKADQSLQLKFRDILSQIERTDIPAELIGLFNNIDDVYFNIANILQTQNIPDVSEVLDIFNFGFGARLLVANDQYIQVDPRAVESVLSEKTRSLVNSVFSRGPLQRFVVGSALQEQIHRTVQDLSPEIANRKLPLQKVIATLESPERNIATRATNSSGDFMTDLVASLQTSICDSLVSLAYSRLNDTLNLATGFLNNITISSGNNALASIVANLISFLVNLAKQGIASLWELAEAFRSNICSNLLSSRKRRDLTFSEDLLVRSKRDTALTEAGSQIIGARSITALLLSLVAGVLSYALTSFVNTTIVSISSFLISKTSDWIKSIINSIFNT